MYAFVSLVQTLPLFPIPTCLMFLSLYTPGFYESFLPCARHTLPKSCYLSTTRPLAVGFLAAIKCFSHLLPRSVSLAPRLWGSLAALQGMSFKGVHFLKEKPSSVLVQKTSFLSYILFFFKFDF